jgi:hypothetical protein
MFCLALHSLAHGLRLRVPLSNCWRHPPAPWDAAVRCLCARQQGGEGRVQLGCAALGWWSSATLCGCSLLSCPSCLCACASLQTFFGLEAARRHRSLQTPIDAWRPALAGCRLVCMPCWCSVPAPPPATPAPQRSTRCLGPARCPGCLFATPSIDSSHTCRSRWGTCPGDDGVARAAAVLRNA